MEFERRKPVGTHLNIAPLIDVIFLLLIFFMLAAQFTDPAGLAITLPAATATPQSLPERIVIALTAAGELYLNDMPIEPEALTAALGSLLAVSARPVVIRADAATALSRVVGIMDSVKSAGAPGLIIATEPVSDEE